MDFNAAIRLNPQHVEALHTLGRLYLGLGDFERAISLFDSVIRLVPRADSYYNRGTSYRSLGRLTDATADYSQAIRLNPLFVEAYGNRGETSMSLGLFEQAITDFDEAIRMNPSGTLASILFT